MKYVQTINEYVVNNKYLTLITKEFNCMPLYHAINSDRAIIALNENKLGGYSFQRTWEGGKRLKDDQSGYEDSLFLRGISTTRDITYANNWNDIIFVFDKNKLKTKYKIVPYNWGYSIGKGYKQGARMKKEREEFVITGRSDSVTYGKNNKSIFYDKKDKINSFLDMKETPKGYIEPLDKYLLGFFIGERYLEYQKDEDIKYLTTHDKYLGIYADDEKKELQK
jgi:hypothetical protein